MRRLLTNKKISRDPKKVLSLSLHGRDADSMFGAIRNLQLHRIFLADWTVRVHLLQAASGAASAPSVGKPLLDKLTSLGADIVYLNSSFAAVNPRLWRYVALDDSRVEHVLVRDVTHRLSEPLDLMTKHWLRSKQPFLCVTSDGDGATAGASRLIDGLTGFRRADVSRALGTSVERLLLTRSLTLSEFLDDVLWPVFKQNAACYSNDMNDRRWAHPGSSPGDRRDVRFDTAFNQFDVAMTNVSSSRPN